MINCKYRQLKDTAEPRPNELKILNLNIRSLYKHIDSIRDNLSNLHKYDVLCFTETMHDLTKLPNGRDSLLLEGFHRPKLRPPNRKSNKGGGLATYVNKNVCGEDDLIDVELDLDPNDLSGEFMFIKLANCKKSGKTIIVGNTYRSPSLNTQKFIDLYDEVLNKLDKYKSRHIIISGDFNIDLIKHETDKFSQNILDVVSKYGYMQTISRPTRLTGHSATLLDHIYSNMFTKIATSSVITLDITDHLATTVTISLEGNFDSSHHRRNMYNKNDNTGTNFRIFNEANYEKFEELIAGESWVLPEGLNPDEQYSKFLEIYTNHYDNAFPLKKDRIRRQKERIDPKPWILPWLEEACDRKNRLYYDWIKNPTIQNKTKYQKMKKFVDKHIKKAKSKYHEKYFNEHKSNSKKQWEMINKLLGRKYKKKNISKLIDENGNATNDLKEISKQFNDYFSNIAEGLKSKIITAVNSDHNYFEDHFGHPVTESIRLTTVNKEEVSKIIKNFECKSTLDTKISALKSANKSTKFSDFLAKIIT